MIPSQLVIGPPVGRSEIKAFVPGRVSGNPEGNSHEPASIGHRPGARLAGDLNLDRAIVEGGRKDDDSASLTVLWVHQFRVRGCFRHHPDGFVPFIGHGMDGYIAGLQSDRRVQ
jgi:hypothetical protein